MSYKKPRPTRAFPTPVEQLRNARAILQRGLDAGSVETALVPHLKERIARIDQRIKELTETVDPNRETALKIMDEVMAERKQTTPTFSMVADALERAGLADAESLSVVARSRPGRS